MDFRFGSNRKLCSTCEYWVGPRHPEIYGGAVVLPKESINGKCWCSNGPWYCGDRTSNSTACTFYKKWAVLK